MGIIFLIPLIAAIGPFFLWPIELVFPYPFLVEELFKLVLIYIVIDKLRKDSLILIFGSSLLFTLSESILYIFNFAMVGSSSSFFTRLLLTLILHTITFLVMYAAGRISIKLLPFGFILAALIHYLYNQFIAGISSF